jgi:hypothetical protein
MKSVLVIGNCQARPISTMLATNDDLNVLEPIVLQIAKPEDKQEHLDKMQQADFILTQKTDKTFHLAHLRSDEVKATYPNAFIWPNVFYGGQQPFLRYFTLKAGGRMFGPLEAMHDLRIYAKWAKLRGVEMPDLQLDDPDYVKLIQEVSLAELRAREAGSDFIISDYIVENQANERLFLTFNHPTRQVLAVLVQRMAEAMKIGALPETIYEGHEPLGRYRTPSSWPATAGASDISAYQGDTYELAEAGGVNRLQTRPKPYSEEELEAAYFEIYDHNPDYRDLTAMRLTPNYAIRKPTSGL